jgi:hypothetical protein
MGWPIKKAFFATAGFVTVFLLVTAPLVSATHNHTGDESEHKCVVCHHAFLSLEPDESQVQLGSQMFALVTLGFSNNTKVDSQPHLANSVRAPPAA